MCRKGVFYRVGLKARWALLISCLTVFARISSLAAGSVTLTWDASPDGSVTGYRVYYGAASGNYTNSAAVGAVTTATFANLTDGVTYYFAAAAFDENGIESELSNEASYAVPVAGGNLPPTLNAISGVTVNEDASLQSVSLSGISDGGNQSSASSHRHGGFFQSQFDPQSDGELHQPGHHRQLELHSRGQRERCRDDHGHGE